VIVVVDAGRGVAVGAIAAHRHVGGAAGRRQELLLLGGEIAAVERVADALAIALVHAAVEALLERHGGGAARPAHDSSIIARGSMQLASR
jgi:hypothetical protein